MTYICKTKSEMILTHCGCQKFKDKKLNRKKLVKHFKRFWQRSFLYWYWYSCTSWILHSFKVSFSKQAYQFLLILQPNVFSYTYAQSKAINSFFNVITTFYMSLKQTWKQSLFYAFSQRQIDRESQERHTLWSRTFYGFASFKSQ